LLEVK